MAQSSLATQGLSRYYQGILSRTNDRQRFVTGKYPVIVTVEENPTQKWLNLGRRVAGQSNAATSLVLVNGTMIDQSLASCSRFQWLDDKESDQLHEKYTSVSLELLAEIHMSKPGYLQILDSGGAGSSAADLRLDTADHDNSNKYAALWKSRWRELVDGDWKENKDRNKGRRERLWVTGFSLAGRKGMIKSLDVHDGRIDSANARSEAMTLWPNELNAIPKLTSLLPEKLTISTNHHNGGQSKISEEEDALLVSDGFLVPGKDQGGIYIIQNPGNPNSEWTTCLTNKSGSSGRWFYHR